MSKIIFPNKYLFLLLLLLFPLSACSPQETIIGRWKQIDSSDKEILEFFKDGTLIRTQDKHSTQEKMSGIYAFIGNDRLQVEIGDSSQVYAIKTLDSERMTLSTEGISMQYTRVHPWWETLLIVLAILTPALPFLFRIVGGVFKFTRETWTMGEKLHQVGYCQICGYRYTEAEVKRIGKRESKRIIQDMISSYPSPGYCPYCGGKGLFWSENYRPYINPAGNIIPGAGSGSGSDYGIKILRKYLARK